MMSAIERIDVLRIGFPLREPYHLSFGTVEELDSVLAVLRLRDGAVGVGESTALPGYTRRGPAEIYETTCTLARDIARRSIREVLEKLQGLRGGFESVAILTALEMAVGEVRMDPCAVPLVGLVQERRGEPPAESLDRVRALGHRSFKAKVGSRPPRDEVGRVVELQESLREGERIRLDANQALRPEAARALAQVCDPRKVECLEQPFGVDAWEEHRRFADLGAVPLMLDESVRGVESVRRAHRAGSALVKTKWMKQGSRADLAAVTEVAHTLKLRVVIGNGVSTGLSNHLEALFWTRELAGDGLAGEMNGYAKLHADLLSETLRVQDGSLVAEAVSPETLAEFVEAREPRVRSTFA